MIRWAMKAIGAMRHPGTAPFFQGFLKRTRYDYRREVGTGIDSSVVTAPIQWVQRAFPEGRLRVMRGPADDREEVMGHPMATLIARPNPFYGDGALWAATIISWYLDGNAYWIKARNGNGKTAELHYVPHWLIEPKWPDDGSQFISRYEYRPGGEVINYAPEDIVHFRHGLDPRNLRKGLSPLHGVLREIFMDMEASNFTASLLRNLGVPGMVVSPDGVTVDSEDAEATKRWIKEAFAGDRRGEPLVMGAPTKVQEYGFDPQKMDLSAARDVAEERVCAAIGIPAAVVGFGAGLQTAKVGATMSELRGLAWHNGVIPLQRALADELARSLLPDFAGARGVGDDAPDFDNSQVGALAEDRLKNAQAWDTVIKGGWGEVAEGRSAIGLDVDDTHRIFLRSFSTVEVPAGRPPRATDNDPADEDEETGTRARTKGRAEVRAAGRRYVAAIEQMEAGLTDLMRTRLATFFQELGAEASVAALPILQEELIGTASAEGGQAKATKQDDQVVARVIEQLELPLHTAAFRRVYEAHYLEVATQIAGIGDMVGLGTNLPDPVARAVVAAGGRRSGLVDLSKQSREALFDALAEGRAEGLGAEALAERIADHVSSGPWASAETRSRTIARTETKFAQNTSTIARAQHAGVERFMVFDGRLGPGRSLPSHIARDGIIVTADEATQMAAAEHPNGTLSFSPYFEQEDDT